jgi:hypothetical protein
MKKHTFALMEMLLLAMFEAMAFADSSETVVQSQESIYVPKDLEDSFVQLQKILTKDEIEKNRSGSETDMGKYFLRLGAKTRNDWGLWWDSRLAEWFNSHGIHHADDMSGIILNSFWRHLNGKPIMLDDLGRVPYYRILSSNRGDGGKPGQSASIVVNLTNYVGVEKLKQVVCDVICKLHLGDCETIGIEIHRGLEGTYLPVDPQVIRSGIGAYMFSLDRPAVLALERDEEGRPVKHNFLALPFNHRNECSCRPED